MIVTTGPDGTIESTAGTVMNWRLPLPTQEERRNLWNSYISDSNLTNQLAREHLHSAGRITELGKLALREAELNHLQQPKLYDIRRAAWSGEGGGLGALAQPMQEDIPDEALVLTGHAKTELDLLLQRCRNRENLADHLGITLSAKYQEGVRTLLVGPSGTGKTLAASWLATQLGLPLYRVDLAAVSSKYIGETEKNLARLLAKAEQDEVVLLFDEADSMFGKRTDIKDANDRYANAQTNYLLQRIESYTGIVVLTSNSRARFDTAFTRRIDMIIEFNLPGPEQRRDLWKAHLGEGHELTPKELNKLASVIDLAGGHIRNAVLVAAVLAKQRSSKIKLTDIAQGLEVEYRKLGKKMPSEVLA
jgi:SpoVK/Ycf46/Vps4 family AAA+-type ATPase